MKMKAASSYRSRSPPGICTRTVHGLDTERFIKPVRHWFDGLRQSLVRGLMFYYIAVRCIWVDKARVAKPGQRRKVEGLVSQEFERSNRSPRICFVWMSPAEMLHATPGCWCGRMVSAGSFSAAKNQCIDSQYPVHSRDAMTDRFSPDLATRASRCHTRASPRTAPLRGRGFRGS